MIFGGAFPCNRKVNKCNTCKQTHMLVNLSGVSKPSRSMKNHKLKGLYNVHNCCPYLNVFSVYLVLGPPKRANIYFVEQTQGRMAFSSPVSIHSFVGAIQSYIVGHMTAS